MNRSVVVVDLDGGCCWPDGSSATGNGHSSRGPVRTLGTPAEGGSQWDGDVME